MILWNKHVKNGEINWVKGQKSRVKGQRSKVVQPFPFSLKYLHHLNSEEFGVDDYLNTGDIS
jgi:hypothetical protein